MTQARSPRADGIRNRANILAAGRELIAAHGAEVSMSQIATEAGVAVGTLYRHFPAKADLVAAVVSEYVTSIAERAEHARDRVTDGADALEEFTGFLTHVVESSVTVNAVKAVGDTLDAGHGDQHAEQRAAAALSSLIHAGQVSGDIHPDVTVADVYLLFASAPTEQATPVLRRWLTLVLPGLTTHSRSV